MAKIIRNFSTTLLGGIFAESVITAVWNKGIPIANLDPDEYRKDICGNIIRYSDYGDTDSVYGWEIDHINPVSNGGTDNLVNLQPLYWANNRNKSDKLNWSCP